MQSGNMKVLHIITRLDRGGSAQNTLLTCQELSRTNDVVLAHGLSMESKMSPLERHSVERQIAEARKNGLRDITIPSLVRRVELLGICNAQSARKDLGKISITATPLLMCRMLNNCQNHSGRIIPILL